MKDKISVLVTAAGSFCAVNIIKSLRLADNYRVITADIDPMSAGLFCADAGYIVPKEGPDGRFIDRILEIVKKEKIDAVIPGFDSELPYFSGARKYFEDRGVQLIIGSEKLIEISNNKLLTSRFLLENKISAPLTFLGKDKDSALKKIKFPVVVKPNNGWGSRFVYLAFSESDVDRHTKEIKKNGFQAIIQEVIPNPGMEFTVSIAVAKDLDILGVIAMKRDLIKGDSRKIWIEEYPQVCRQAAAIASKIGSCGPINLQGRLDRGIFKVFEINARFSTTTFVRACCGFNEVDAIVRNYMGKGKIKLSVKRKALAVVFPEYAIFGQKDFNRLLNAGYTKKKGTIKSVL